MDLLPIRVAREDVAAAFAAAMQERADAIVLTDDWLFFMARAQVGDVALRHRVPVLSAAPGTADAGILLRHLPPVLEVCHRSARFADRILRGAKAGELPIEAAPRFEVVINLKTAADGEVAAHLVPGPIASTFLSTSWASRRRDLGLRRRRRRGGGQPLPSRLPLA